jgi:hypothetical protein
MREEKREEIAQPASYWQKKRDIVVEHEPHTLAVRYSPKGKETVMKGLSALGEVRLVEPQRLLVVRFPQAARQEAAQAQLLEWQEEGLIEFVTPVLRDQESQLAQIVTDEITVRFKPNLAPEKREDLERKYNVTAARQNEFIPNQYVVKVAGTEGLKTLKVASQLDSEAEVEFAVPNFISQLRR